MQPTRTIPTLALVAIALLAPHALAQPPQGVREFRAVPIEGLQLAPPAETPKAKAGDAIEVVVRATYAGNATLNVSFNANEVMMGPGGGSTSPSVEARAEPASATLEPGEAIDVKVTVTVRGGARAGHKAIGFQAMDHSDPERPRVSGTQFGVTVEREEPKKEVDAASNADPPARRTPLPLVAGPALLLGAVLLRRKG